MTVDEALADGIGEEPPVTEETSNAEKPATTEAGAATAEAKPATKPKGKAGKKSKAKASVDLIAEVCHEVENMTKEEALATIGQLSEQADYSYFKLGGTLAVIQQNGWFADEGYESLRDLIEQAYGLNYRTGMYWVGIYNGLVESQVPWEKVKDLGWTKLRDLADLLTPENVEEWVNAVKDMTVLQMKEYIKEKKKGTLPAGNEGDTEEPAKTTTNMTFKAHADQAETITAAVDKAKNEADTEVDTVALEAICMNYLSGGGTAKATAGPTGGLKDAMKASAWEEVLEVFEELWPDVVITVEQ